MFHGFVDGLQDGKIHGWVVDADRPQQPIVVEAVASGCVLGRAVTNIHRPDTGLGSDVLAGFCIALDATRNSGGGPVTVRIADTNQILRGVAIRVPAPISSMRRRPLQQNEAHRAIDVIVPIYRGVDETIACLQSAMAAQRWDGNLIIVNDCSPEPALPAAVAELVMENRTAQLIINFTNHGFPYSVNRGMERHPDRDIILLNSDTLVHGDWIDRMRTVAYSSHDIGTVTALSNEASICSYPAGAHFDPAEVDGIAARANKGAVIDLPTAIGFCMFIRRDCLAEVGLFDADTFGRGYGEENDFCMRARLYGWRHVCAPNVYVPHQGALSFGSDASPLQLRNSEILERFYPGYDALVQGWIAADPLRHARDGLNLGLISTSDREAILLIAPEVEGGIARHLTDRRAEIAESGQCAVTLLPAGGDDVRVQIAAQEFLDGLIYSIADDLPKLLELLRLLKVGGVELHHLLGHHRAVADLAAQLRVPMSVFVHDYSWICPRVSLINDRGKFCGLPEAAECERCAGAPGSRIDLSSAALRARSTDIFRKAAEVVAPSRDAAARMGGAVECPSMAVRPWETVTAPHIHRRRGGDRPRKRICIVGAIGDVKGYDLLLACARDAARRNLPIEFALVGYSQGDTALIATGRVTITGRFEEEESLDHIRAQDADIAFLPSIGPETWSYALTTLWRAGLQVVTLDLGAQAERIWASGNGWVISRTLTPAQINEFLMAPAAQDMQRAAE